MQGFASDKYDFGYKFIPKVACSSIKHALLKAEGHNLRKRLVLVKKNKQEAWSFSNATIRVLGANSHKLVNRKKLDDITNYKERFLVVRDPVKRFISAYRNRVGAHDALGKGYIKKHHTEIYDYIPAFRPTLSEFVKNFDIYKQVDQINHHVRSFSDFFEGYDLSFFTDVYAFENLKLFESKLSGIYDQKVTFPKLQKGGFKVSFHDLTRSELDWIIDLSQEDYKLLKDFYTPDKIVNEWKNKR